MKRSLPTTVWRLGAFVAVCVLGIFGLFAVFGQLRFDSLTDYKAVFNNVSGLEKGNFVRIAGVEVGKIRDIAIVGNSTLMVTFGVEPDVVLTQGTRAVIRYDNLIRGRFMSLEEGAGATRPLPAGATIPIANTAPALDLDALIGGFRPLFRALDPAQVNALSAQLVSAFQDQGATISSFLAQTAVLTNTLADRDRLIGEVITNLNTLLGAIGDQSDQFAKAIDSLTQLVHGLAEHKDDVTNGIAYTDAASRSIAALLSAGRPGLHAVVTGTDRAAGIVMADHDYLDNLLNGLPDAYRALSRQGMYGDYFSFYLCDIVLKVNGKGGQPVYIRVAGQSTGRCAPK
ncbi:mammalian cell entry protein [Mycobacterium florentinum]|uniref:Mammalian cell entry protein n=1 Tax=Mycobacterium florentinum TaxID=292462 RepID=A0A1X1UKS1_MYCFL|nr:MCE family protein [Mycobacterium florentinum]MCV7411377.1 MCE family protein [Mycobacterium florentinum]ORV57460.1 mammalian cell entry protein [Mycobacterium florentinum]BBX80737.1 mammalian cell entry protein [Mycobacterium florentinum]